MDTEEPLPEDSEYIHSDEMTLNPSDNATTDYAVQTERPKLYNKALFLLKLKEEQRLSQVTINNLIGDVSTLMEEENVSLKKMSSNVYRRG